MGKSPVFHRGAAWGVARVQGAYSDFYADDISTLKKYLTYQDPYIRGHVLLGLGKTGAGKVDVQSMASDISSFISYDVGTGQFETRTIKQVAEQVLKHQTNK